MISEPELKWISRELETGRVSAPAAFRTIQALKNQQKHIAQLNDQLSYVQGMVKK